MVLFAFVFPISLGGANAILGIILLLWIIEGDWNKKVFIFKSEKVIWIFLAIGTLTLISAFLSPSMSYSFLAGETKSLLRVILSHYMLIPLILFIMITSIKKEFIHLIISAFLLAILLSEVSSYLIFFELIDVIALQEKGLIFSHASIHSPTPFMHHTEYSVFLSLASILLLDQLLHSKNRYLQLFLFLFLLSASINLFINGGRTGQISYILSMMVYLLFYFKFTIKSIFSTLVSLSLIIVLAYNFSPNFKQRVHDALQNIEQISNGNYNTSWGLRVASTKVTLDYLTSSPTNFIFGAGAGETRKVYLHHAKTHFDTNISEPIKILAHIHNQYLQYWMDGTLLSLLLFLTFFILLLRLPLSSLKKPLLYAYITVVAFASATDIPFFRYQPAMLFMLISAYFILLSKEPNQESHSL